MIERRKEAMIVFEEETNHIESLYSNFSLINWNEDEEMVDAYYDSLKELDNVEDYYNNYAYWIGENIEIF
jgi:hypothetical protein